jgi:LmbE family N-acetylglucosaminyl deacetylase/uncharacterized membrane protein HdeD (DUF308 family)
MYFRELKTQYINRWWISLLRSILSLSVGILLLLLPGTTTVAFLWIVGVALVFDALIIALPLLLGKTTTHVWKIVLAREVVQIILGVLLLIDVEVGIELFLLVIALILLFRAVIELISFVEQPATALSRRWMLLLALLFFALAIRTLSAVFAEGVFLIDLIALYLIFEGVSHLVLGLRNRRDYQQVETYERALLADEAAPDANARQKLSKPQPPPDRAFLLPHIAVAKYRKILVFSPHPDDLEAFVGGLAYRLSGEVISAIFSGGDKGRWAEQFETMDDGMYIRTRLEESEEAAQILGVREINYLGYLDREVPDNEEAVHKVLQMLNVHRPDMVVSFEFHKRATPYPHPDHLATANVVRKAIARYEQAETLDYFVTATLLPNHFIDVTGVRRLKLDALACHTTQTDLNKLIFPFLEKLFSRLWGTFSGVDYAEGYRKVNITALRERLQRGE